MPERKESASAPLWRDGSAISSPPKAEERESSPQQKKKELTKAEQEKVRERLVDIYNNPNRVPFADIIEPSALQMLSRAAGGFIVRTDAEMAREFAETGRLKTLYTNKNTRVVYVNPVILQGVSELEIKPWSKAELRGGLIHEAGHHAPEVLKLDAMLQKDIGNVQIIPDVIRGTAKREEAFFGALYSQLHNSLLDMWLEAFMSREGFERNKLSLNDLYYGMGDMESYRHLPLPGQFVQALLRVRFYSDKSVEKKLHPKAYEWYRRAVERRTRYEPSAFDTLLDTSQFEGFFRDERSKEQAIGDKFAVYKSVFLPAWIDLLVQEIEEKKMEFRQWKAEHPEGMQMFGGLEELLKQLLEYGEKHKGESRLTVSNSEPLGVRSMGAAVGGGEGESEKPKKERKEKELPELTSEENEMIVNKVLGILEEHGGHGKGGEDDPEMQELWKKVKKMLEEREEAIKEKKDFPPPPEEKKPPSGADDLAHIARQLRRESEEQEMQDRAKREGVNPEAVRRWDQIKESYKFEIESFAGSLAEIFLEDRRSRLKFMQREGEIVPGLEYETVGALMAGETDPQTRMRSVRNPEFLETEVQFIFDRSGSMSDANRLDRSAELAVIVIEAFKRVRELLSNEGLVGQEEFPFRVGASEFSDTPRWITKADEPLSDTKELQLIDGVLFQQGGGGTYARGAVESIQKELSVGKKNVIKFMIVFTDADGHYDSVDEPMKAIEADKSILFYVVGFGETPEAAQGTVDRYLNPLKTREGNASGIAVVEPRESIPHVLPFIKREVAKRRSSA